MIYGTGIAITLVLNILDVIGIYTIKAPARPLEVGERLRMDLRVERTGDNSLVGACFGINTGQSVSGLHYRYFEEQATYRPSS